MIKRKIQIILFLMILSGWVVGGPATINVDQYMRARDIAPDNRNAAEFFRKRQLGENSHMMNLQQVHGHLDLLLGFMSAQDIMDAVLAHDSLTNYGLRDGRLFEDRDVIFQAEIVGRLLQEGAHIVKAKHLHVGAISQIKYLIAEKEGISRFIEIVMSSEKASKLVFKEVNGMLYSHTQTEPEVNESVRAWIKDILKQSSNISAKVRIDELNTHMNDTEFIELFKKNDMILCNTRYVDEISENGLLEMFKNPQMILDQKYKNLSAERSDVAKVPYIVHHIWLTHPADPKEIRPQDLAIVIANRRTFGLSAVEWRHIVWTNDKSLIPESVKKLEAEGIEVRSIYDYKEEIRLWGIIEDSIDKKRWGMASDALRYSIVYLFGGFYSDLNFTFSRDFTEEAHRYNFMGLSFNLYEILPYMFMASERHPVLEKVIEIIDRNFKNPPEYIKTLDREYQDGSLVVHQTLLKVTNAIHLGYYNCANMGGNVDIVYPMRKIAFIDDDRPSPSINDFEDDDEKKPSIAFTFLMKEQCKDHWAVSEAGKYISSNEICGIDRDEEGSDSDDGGTWL